MVKIKVAPVAQLDRAPDYGKYEIQPATDGMDWMLKLRSPDGKVKYATGYEKYPDTFNNLVAF